MLGFANQDPKKLFFFKLHNAFNKFAAPVKSYTSNGFSTFLGENAALRSDPRVLIVSEIMRY